MTMIALRSRLTAQSARRRTNNTAKLLAAFALIAAVSINVSPVYGQTATGGTIGKPVPAPPHQYPDGTPAPGCMIGFTPPNWPGEGPDFPCAARCEGPNAADKLPTVERLRDACMEFGPDGVADTATHPDYPGKDFNPGLAPPGSTTCWIMSGEPGMPNGSQWYPKGHPRCAGVYGDPHLTTFDSKPFDLQAAGEFIAAKSLDDELEVQMRLVPLFSISYVSFVQAVAARVGPHRVMIAADSDTPLRIDGNPVELADGYALHINNGRASIIRHRNRYSVVWPDGTNLHVDLFDPILNFNILPAEARDGRLVGVLGNADGDDGKNDFRTRDGKALASPPQFPALYKVFAESWRITAKESLFHYEAGQSTETFTLRDHPSRHITVNDMDPDIRARAEQRCREAGVADPVPLADCIYDFGFSGDEVYIASALSRETFAELRALGFGAEATGQPAGLIRIDAPSQGIAAHSLEVRLSGPVRAGYWLGSAPAGSPKDGKATNPYSDTVLSTEGAQLVKLIVPSLPGEYELRYRENGGEFTVVQRQPFRSLAPKLTIEAPAAVEAGSNVDVRLSGDVGDFMTLLVVPAGSPIGATGPNLGVEQGTEARGTFQLFNTPPGEYEIRCISSGGVGTQAYARRKLTIR